MKALFMKSPACRVGLLALLFLGCTAGLTHFERHADEQMAEVLANAAVSAAEAVRPTPPPPKVIVVQVPQPVPCDAAANVGREAPAEPPDCCLPECQCDFPCHCYPKCNCKLAPEAPVEAPAREQAPDPYTAARERAIRESRFLVVWVRCEDPLAQKYLREAVHVRVESFDGTDPERPSVVVGRPEGDNLRRIADLKGIPHGRAIEQACRQPAPPVYEFSVPAEPAPEARVCKR